ncbi:UDP-N-acetylglucosamine 1-carboxyvinyltransferase [Metallumcola ferriviriculae]|uniref:UDP-N-acetylglucosamine 1-carboxyvinyltransferase n=1 Tax=Metallumcola ferriviriculae TaxID=3039180 RepID=A0AAU0UN69_9FIRM|nr:UDP-N-acetylglucosamine 1-carboxyvinyltransferase [Desulfitibacteraceae bacterium MK1]
MEKLIIMGGTKLKGTVKVSGSKNAVLPIMAASLLCDGQTVIHNVPRLRDVLVMEQVLQFLGAKTSKEGSALTIDTRGVNPQRITEVLMRKLRASNLVMGPLIARYGEVQAAYPGGCAIGSRPMDLHTKGFQNLGVQVSEKFGYIYAKGNKLAGADIHLDVPSVGATENIMMAASLIHGETILHNAAREPEIVDLQNFLNLMGAKVTGAGMDVIRILGVNRLRPVEHEVIPDRIEAGTHMLAAAVTGGKMKLIDVIPEHVEPVIAKLREAGIEVQEKDNSIEIISRQRPGPIDIKTMPYPGFPTDMQPQMMVLMSISQGTGIVSESIFENRFRHVDELRRMGAHIKLEGNLGIIKGVPKLSGALVEAPDLRAGAALVLAGMAANDITVVENVHHIDRGYENLEQKYTDLGARIVRVNNGFRS